MHTQTARIDITDDIASAMAKAVLQQRVETSLASVVILADKSFQEAHAEVAAGGALKTRMVDALAKLGLNANEAAEHIQACFGATRVWYDNAWRRILGEDLELEWD